MREDSFALAQDSSSDDEWHDEHHETVTHVPKKDVPSNSESKKDTNTAPKPASKRFSDATAPGLAALLTRRASQGPPPADAADSQPTPKKLQDNAGGPGLAALMMKRASQTGGAAPAPATMKQPSGTKNGRRVGRRTSDDQVPAVAALFAKKRQEAI